MKKIFAFATMLILSLSLSAQTQMHIWMDGSTLKLSINEIDSITFVDPNASNPDTPDPDPTPDPSTDNGIGVFSIAEVKQVTFSKGNLQYHPANDKWRFAENQTDYIGDANSNISSTYNGWIDLFGWSTSATYFGVSTSTDHNDYSGAFVDWSTNQIGTDAPNKWRTLSSDEWNYLRNGRPNASSLCGVAQVNGVNGLVLLPDNWTCPAGVSFQSGFHSEWGVDYYAAYQTFTADQWSKLEAAGAVFLPASGYRYGSWLNDVQYGGYYWSATESSSYFAYVLYFTSDAASIMGNLSCGNGLSVRLVKNIATNDTPDKPTDPYNGHEYVDLGLSVKWATCNVGANTPEECGDYFAWGETEPKSTYDWSTYKYCNGSSTTLTKYCTSSRYGTVDNKTTLELSDDAARANWGGSWRMPTDAEITELREQCTWTWTSQNGVNGYEVTSKKNGKSIFLPAAGFHYETSLDYVGNTGCYWSYLLYSDEPFGAYYLGIASTITSGDYSYRCYGFSVRPVCQ